MHRSSHTGQWLGPLWEFLVLSLVYTSAVREITKSSSTFSATNISSNVVWFLPLHGDFVRNFIFGTKFSSIYLAKWENAWFFDYDFLTCSVRKMVLMCLMQNIDMHAWYHASLITFPNECLPCNKKIRLNLVSKMKFYTSIYIIKWLLMAIYIIVDSRKLSFNFNCIMKLKQFKNIVTKS